MMSSTDIKTTPNEWKKGWMIVLSAFLISFIADGLLFSFGIMLVEILDYFGEGRATTSGIVAVLSAAQYFFGPLASALGEKYGYRIIVIIGSLVSCTGFVLSSFASNVYHLWIAYGFLGGLGFGFVILPAYVCVLQHFNKHRALAVGITACGSGTGTFAFNYCLRLMIDHYGWRGTLLLEAGFTLQGVVFGLLLEESKKKVAVEPGEETSFVASVKAFFFSVFNPQLLKDLRCMMYMLAVLFISLAFIVPFTYLPDQVEQEGMTKSEAAMLTSAIGIANTVSRVIFGWVGDRICFSRLVLLMIVVLLVGVVTGLSPLMSTFETKLVYTSLFGTLIGGYVALLYAVLADIVKHEQISNAFGLLLLSVGIGVTTGTPIAGYLFDQTGSYKITFIVCGAEFVVGAILLFICKLCRPKDNHEIIECTHM